MRQKSIRARLTLRSCRYARAGYTACDAYGMVPHTGHTRCSREKPSKRFSSATSMAWPSPWRSLGPSPRSRVQLVRLCYTPTLGTTRRCGPFLASSRLGARRSSRRQCSANPWSCLRPKAAFSRPAIPSLTVRSLHREGKQIPRTSLRGRTLPTLQSPTSCCSPSNRELDGRLQLSAM